MKALGCHPFLSRDRLCHVPLVYQSWMRDLIKLRFSDLRCLFGPVKPSCNVTAVPEVHPCAPALTPEKGIQTTILMAGQKFKLTEPPTDNWLQWIDVATSAEELCEVRDSNGGPLGPGSPSTENSRVKSVNSVNVA